MNRNSIGKINTVDSGLKATRSFGLYPKSNQRSLEDSEQGE